MTPKWKVRFKLRKKDSWYHSAWLEDTYSVKDFIGFLLLKIQFPKKTIFIAIDEKENI